MFQSSYQPSVQVADRLRTHLMGSAPRIHPPRCGAAPAGLVDVRRAAPEVAVLPTPPWSDPELRFLVRPEVAERLHGASARLPGDVRLGFWEGLRPLAIQRSLWETSLAYLSDTYPGTAHTELETVLERYVARPTGPAPHSTGSAVDIAAVGPFGRVLSPQDAWGRLGIAAVARALRDAGLVNYEPEWWHWSYGDEEWARAYDCAPLDFAPAPEFDGPGGGI